MARRHSVLDHPSVASAWAAVEDAIARYERSIGQALAGGNPTPLVDTKIHSAVLAIGDEAVDFLTVAVARGSVGNPVELEGKTLIVRER
jgi:hypothetical protein